ncbi:MAG: MFS transporter [Proteobacteria bacterium]|nr:MFS transporter [Pseudomonadota bacterium]
MSQRVKITTAVIIGNILDYYDFLLFAHFGSIITPYFFPSTNSKESHILSLFLFGGAFVIRPVGGIIFGYISDVFNRKTALLRAIQFAIFPSLAIAFLPSYEYIGLAASSLFVLFRLLQGFSLGGEYTNAGTYLMEYHKKQRGFVSGCLAASGTIGSMIGLGASAICVFYQETIPWLWRIAFLLGGVAAFWTISMRRSLVDIVPPRNQPNQKTKDDFGYLWLRRVLVIFIGILVGTTNWLPATYTNFYVTKILNQPTVIGQQCTMIALVSYIALSPLMGFFADRTKHYEQFMKITALLAAPLSIGGFMLLAREHYYLAQIFLVIASSSFGAAIHPVMNSLFPASVRARNVSLLFTIGLSVGGMAPGMMSYFVDKTGWHLIPALFVSAIAVLMAFLFFIYEERHSKIFLQSNKRKSVIDN